MRLLMAITGSIATTLCALGAAAQDTQGTLSLSLADAITMGLENNVELEILRHDPLIADETYQISWGAYDPILGGEAGYFSEEPLTTSVIFQASNTERADGRAELRGLLPYLGASYAVSYDGERSDSDSIIQGFNPEYTADVTFAGTLPLLRGLVWNQAWTTIQTSDVLRGESLEDFRGQVMRIVQFIETLYWELVKDRQNLAVAHKSLEAATALLDQVQTRYDVGVVSRVDVVEAEAGVAQREFQLISAKNIYRNSQDNLINATLGVHLTAETALEINPSEPPEAYKIYEIDVPKAVEIALSKRPELRSARLAVERGELELRFQRNARLPQLDLRGSYGFNGLSGKGSTGNAPTGQDFGDASRSLFTGDDGNVWDARAILSIPIGNIAGRHSVSRAKLQLRRAATQVDRQKLDIILEVRQSARNLLSGLEGIEAAERERLAAEEQLRAEKVRLEHGESTPFEVLQREEALVQAEFKKIDALNVYRTSETALLQAQGIILEARNIVFAEAAPLR